MIRVCISNAAGRVEGHVGSLRGKCRYFDDADGQASAESAELARRGSTSIWTPTSGLGSGHMIAPMSETVQSLAEAGLLAHRDDESVSNLENVDSFGGTLQGAKAPVLL